jgi:hypothetical protein
MFDTMAQKYGLALPISDLLYSDPYDPMMAGVESARYAGKHRVGSHECVHLAFKQEELDWQIWIDAGEHPFPRRMAIRYEGLEGSPAFMATFTKWEPSTKFDEKHFRFEPPKDAVQVDLIPIDGEAGDAAPSETKP